MFTGIIEAQGELVGLRQDGGNIHLDVRAPFVSELQVDQASLTTTLFDGGGDSDDLYTVTAVEETLKKTHLGSCQEEHVFNLERCVAVGDRIDGHVVQGHVDTTGVLADVQVHDGSWELTVTHPVNREWITVLKAALP